MSSRGARRAGVVVVAGVLLVGLVACDSDGVSPPRTGASGSHPVSAPSPPAAAALTREQARRAVLAVEDFGPGWSAGALTETLPGPDEDDGQEESTGDEACDRAGRDFHTGDERVLVRAEREFERDATGVGVVVDVEVLAGNGAAERLRRARALLERCGDVGIPMGDGITVTYRALAAPVVADGAVGMRMTVAPTPTGGPGTVTADRMTVRSGPNTVTLLVVKTGTLDPATLDALTRRAAARLVDTGRG